MSRSSTSAAMRLRAVEEISNITAFAAHRLARLDVALHHRSGERREDRIILELPREEIDGGRRLVALLLRALQSLHRQDAAVHQRLVARDVRLRHRQARLRVLKPGARLPVVEPRDDVALAHFVAFVDQKLGDPAGDRRAEPGVIDRLDDAGRIDRLDRRTARRMSTALTAGWKYMPVPPSAKTTRAVSQRQRPAPRRAAYRRRRGSSRAQPPSDDVNGPVARALSPCLSRGTPGQDKSSRDSAEAFALGQTVAPHQPSGRNPMASAAEGVSVAGARCRRFSQTASHLPQIKRMLAW